MRQLNLFGEEIPPQPEELPVLQEADAGLKKPDAAAQPAIEEQRGHSDAEQPPTANSLIFEDASIAVKIKFRKTETPAEEVKTGAAAETGAAANAPPEPFLKRGRIPLTARFDISDIQIPDDEALYSKKYYPISTVAKWFNVNASLIRYWETEFPSLKPRKNKKGDRLFRPEDVKTMVTIYYLLRQKKYTIEGAKAYLKNNRDQAEDNLLLIETLKEIRAFFIDLKFNLE